MSNRRGGDNDEDDNDDDDNVQEFDVDLGNNESFLDTLVSQETRRRPNQSPVFGYIYSPRCMRGAGLIIAIVALLFSAVLLSISFSDLNKTNGDDSSDDSGINFNNKLPLWVLDNINIDRIKSNVQYLSSDLLEGRAPGSRGEELATLFIKSQYQASSIEPMGDNGTYFQNVTLYASNDIQSSMNLTSATSTKNQQQVNLTYVNDYVTSTEIQGAASISLTQIPIVFAGYGIDSEVMQWNDYIPSSQNDTVKDKIAMILLGAPSSFNESTSAYFGRKDYKLSVARQKGAIGVILIHTDASYGYPWPYVQSMASNTKYLLKDAQPQPLQFISMITQDSAEQIISQSTKQTNLADWQSIANSTTFKSFDIGLKIDFEMDSTNDIVIARNVIGGIIGDQYPDEVVVVMAHHDHLGMKSNGDEQTPSIYHGAVDDASGVAIILELANILGLYNKIAKTNTFSQVGLISPPDRTILFVSTTAEEGGLLGAQYFLNQTNKQIVAVINFDGANVLNETLDIVSVGMGLSPDLDLFVKTAAYDENRMTVTQDILPQFHLLYRNDALVFLQNNIPSVMLSMGTHFKGINDSYYVDVITDYFQNVYHTPGDIMKPEYTFLGSIQQIRITARLLYYLSNNHFKPLLSNPLYSYGI